MPAAIRAKLEPAYGPVKGFSGEICWPLGRVTLPIVLEDGAKRRSCVLAFLVIRAPSMYNVLLGRYGLREFGAVPSTVHGMLKFPTPLGVATIKSQLVTECYAVEPAVKAKEKNLLEDDM